jgi:uracil-DNA glycosylase family 4
MQHITVQKRNTVQRRTSPFQALCDCGHCSLFTEMGRTPKTVPGAGNPQARIIFVGEAPGVNEVFQALPFVGESGRLLNDTLRDVGLRREDVYCTNAVLCRPMNNRDPTAKEILACNKRLKQEILSLPERHVIVVLGTPAVKAVTGRNQGITSVLYSTEWSEDFQCFLVFSYHPAYCLRNPDPYQDVLRTFQHAKDLLDAPKGLTVVPSVTYTLEDTVEHCLMRLEKIQRSAKGYISCDIETTGLDWRLDTLEQLGIGWNFHGKDHAYLIPKSILSDSAVTQALRRLFARRDIKWSGHNFKFDGQFIKRYGIPEVHVDIDTMLLSKSLDERNGVHGLKQLGARYFGDYNYGEEKDTFTDPIYHAKDCIYTLRLARDILPKELARERPSHNGYPGPQYRHDHVLIPVWNAITDIELAGVPVDREAAIILAKEMGDYPNPELGGTLLAQQKACQALAGYKIPKERKEKSKIPLPAEFYQIGEKKGQQKPEKTKSITVTVTERVPINLSSPTQIGHLLYDVWGLPISKTTPKGQPSVDEETLVNYIEMVQDSLKNRFLRALLAHRKELKLYSTYVLAAINESAWDGSLHTHFSFNPVTGRPSSADLNIQNIPRKSPIKKLYIAPPGHWFVEADYGQQEMRGAAWYSKDRGLLKACMESDFHTAVSKMVFHRQYAEIDACCGNLVALEHLIITQTTYRQLAAEHAKKPFDVGTLLARLYDLWRFRAKAVSFGKLYGQTPIGLQEALAADGVDASLEETTEYHRVWDNRFPATIKWLEKQCHDIVEYGFVDTPMGHRRRKFLISEGTLKETFNQAMNSPIQSLSSDMTMLSVIQLHELLLKLGIGCIGFFVHDSIAFFIKKERLREGAVLIKQVMEHALDPIQDKDFYVPFPIDMKYGRGWGELQPLEL